MKKNVFMCLAATALLVSCSKVEVVEPVSDAVPVELSGILNAGTRAAIQSDETTRLPEVKLDLSVFRADATAGTTYGAAYTNADAINGEFNTDGQVVLTPEQYYLIDETKSSKFIAVYPQIETADYSSKYVSADRTVEYAINGETDIIASTVVEGSKATPISTYMEFSHLLTQLQVSVIADTDVISGRWGKVTGITINGKDVPALVTLPAPNTSDVATIAQKPSTTPTPLALASSYDAASGLVIPATTAELFGYAIFLPSASETLTLNVTTELSGAAKTVTIPAQPWVAGNAYAITIRFKADGSAIVEPGKTGEDAATLAPWIPVPPTAVELD